MGIAVVLSLFGSEPRNGCTVVCFFNLCPNEQVGGWSTFAGLWRALACALCALKQWTGVRCREVKVHHLNKHSKNMFCGVQSKYNYIDCMHDKCQCTIVCLLIIFIAQPILVCCLFSYALVHSDPS